MGKRCNPHVEVNKYTENFTVEILRDDDITGQANETLANILRNELILPLDDKIEFWKDDEEAKVFLDQVKLLTGQAAPVPYHTLTEMASDESISRYFFYGMGSLLTLAQSTAENKWPELGVVVVDLDVSSLKVRDGFLPYGIPHPL